MKQLQEYIAESKKQYEYRIKIAGEFPKEIFDKIKTALEMYQVANCTDPKKTPIQKDPYGFPGLHNEEIHFFDVTLDYPANSQQVIEIARQNGINPSKIVVVGKEFNDSMNQELEGVEDGTRLETPDYPAQTKEQKAASEAYADSYKKAAAEFANGDSAQFEITGKEKTQVQYNTDKDDGKDSPLSKVKRSSVKDMLK